jgi:hypothetical protein
MSTSFALAKRIFKSVNVVLIGSFKIKTSMGRFFNGYNNHNIFGKKELSLWTKLGISKELQNQNGHTFPCVNTGICPSGSHNTDF